MKPNNFKILVNTDKAIPNQFEILDTIIEILDDKNLGFDSENIYVYDMDKLYVSVKISKKNANYAFDEITRNVAEFFENEKENKCVVFTNVNFSVESINSFFTEILKNSTRNVIVIGKNCIQIDKEINVISCGKSVGYLKSNLKKLIKKLVPVEVKTKNKVIYLSNVNDETKKLLTENLSENNYVDYYFLNLESHMTEDGLFKLEERFTNVYNTKNDKQKIIVINALFYNRPILTKFCEIIEKYIGLLNSNFVFLFSNDILLETFIGEVAKPNLIYGFSSVNYQNINDTINTIFFGIEPQIKQPLQQENNIANQSNNNQKETYSHDCIILNKVSMMNSIFALRLAKIKSMVNIGKRFFHFTDNEFQNDCFNILFDLFSSDESEIILFISDVDRHEKYLDLMHNYESLFDNIQVVLGMDEEVVLYVQDRFASPTVKSVLLDLSTFNFDENFFIEKCNKKGNNSLKELSNINITVCKDLQTFHNYYGDVLNDLKSTDKLLFEFDLSKNFRKLSLSISISEILKFETKKEKIIVFSSTKTLGVSEFVDGLIEMFKNDSDTKIIIIDSISEINGRLLTKLGLSVDKFIQTSKEVIELEETIQQQNNTDNQHKADTFIQKHKPKIKSTPYFSDGKMENVLYVEYHPEFKHKIVIGTQTNYGTITNFKYEKSTRTTFLTLENKSDVTVMDVDSDDLEFFLYKILTEDLHAKYEGDEAYFVNKDFKTFPYKETINDFYSSENIKNKITFFHSEDKAKVYSNLNMPLFSMQEMINLFGETKKLKKAYKRKLK